MIVTDNGMNLLISGLQFLLATSDELWVDDISVQIL